MSKAINPFTARRSGQRLAGEEMQLQRHNDVESFLRHVKSWLLRAEVENNLVLGICNRLISNPDTADPEPYLAAVEHGGEVVACALRTPPHKAIITRGLQPALGLLVDDLFDKYGNLSAILGPEPDVQRFAELWSARTGSPNRAGMKQRLFQIQQVEPLEERTPGRMRLAVAGDIPVVGRWTEAFCKETNVSEASSILELALKRVREGDFYLWEEPRPVSMAAVSGRTPHGCRISYVYTPPEQRGHGYASACVRDLTELLLSKGNAYCCLVTDLANPTSNRIYQRIGYRPVCDFTDCVFTG